MNALSRHFSLLLAYDGSEFHGWQRQPCSPTVQGALETTLGRLLDQPVRVRGAGRTDAGVHALGQWATFSARTDRPLPELLRGLNALLPPSVRVREAAESREPLDALRQTRRKTYFYQMHLGTPLPPHRRTSFVPVTTPLSLGAMRAAALALQGRHDFAAFAAHAGEQSHCVRELTRVRLLRIPSGLRLFFTASGFLYHMARNLVAALWAVGDGRWDPDDLSRALAARDRALVPATAPPQGLFLFRVDWDPPVAKSLVAPGRLHRRSCLAPSRPWTTCRSAT